MEKYMSNGKRLRFALRVLIVMAGLFAVCAIGYVGWTMYLR